MIPPQAFLSKLASRLEGAGIRWMLTGSVVSSVYGEARPTHDIDIVIDADMDELEKFLAGASSDGYVSKEAAREALRERGMFNVIDFDSGWKAVLIFRPNSAFDREEFDRRREIDLLGSRVFVISPEGSILSKLRWAVQSGSERQLRDAAAVFERLASSLDRSYLEKQARLLGVSNLLERVYSLGG